LYIFTSCRILPGATVIGGMLDLWSFLWYCMRFGTIGSHLDMILVLW